MGLSRMIQLGVLVVVVGACNPFTPPSPTPASSAEPDGSPTAQPSATPTDSAPAGGFYLRAYYSQALPPRSTFGWLPVLTIADGAAIDGNVAVPAIFPGPLVINPVARSITDDGIARISDEARRLGLLDGGDFTGGATAPGSRLAHIALNLDGTSYLLTGDPDRLIVCVSFPCEAPAGTPEAFGAFWQELSNLDPWLGGELGPTDAYKPERMALLLVEPAPDQGVAQQPVAWPLAQPLDTVGVPFPGEDGVHCVTLTGDDVDDALPILSAANQLTVFVDHNGAARSLVVAVLVPGQPSPCPDTT